MILSKILANISILLLGIYLIISTARDIKSERYPLWISICDMIANVCFCLCSFTVWLIN